MRGEIRSISQAVTRSKPKIMQTEVRMKGRNRGAQLGRLFFAALLLSVALVPSYAFSQVSFFQGKTLPLFKDEILAEQEIFELKPCSLFYRNIYRETRRL